MPLFDMILGEASVVRYEFELPRAELELTSRLAATFLEPAHPDRPAGDQQSGSDQREARKPIAGVAMVRMRRSSSLLRCL